MTSEQEEGTVLIQLARQAIADYLKGKSTSADHKTKQILSDEHGVFVTLHKDRSLRGCIGFTETDMPLYESVVNAAVAAAFKDPRFPPLNNDEIEQVTIEVSVLTKPQWIQVRNPEDYLSQIRIGEDGLIVQGVYEKGLLLPQVPVEQRWDVKTFISQTCIKAGLPPEKWIDFESVRLYKFQAIVFSEQSPNGPVVRTM